MSRTILCNAVIINDNRRFNGYVIIDGEFIAEVGEGDLPQSSILPGDTVENLHEKYLLPGAIDDQVHFRDPGLTHKADIATESAAAVAGGVTSFMDMPNTMPQTVTIEALDAKHERASRVSAANYSFYIGATNDNIDTLLQCDYSRVPGVKLFLGASTGNMLVDNDKALHRIFSEVPALIAIHSEDEDIIRRNKETFKKQFAGKEIPIEAHPLIRSEEACFRSTARAVEMASHYGTRLHILHLSTAAETALLSAGDISGKKITAEVCAHHLWWSDKDYTRSGTRIKWNPAIKTEHDRTTLRQALNDGRIDVVATDHAPHLLTEKEGDALTAASGAPLVQFSLPMMLELADNGIFSHETVVEKMAHAPARLFNIEKRGYIRKGFYADLTVVQPGSDYTVTDSMVLSRCAWTPLDGTTLHNRVVSTYVNGKRVYHNGKVDHCNAGRPLIFSNI